MKCIAPRVPFSKGDDGYDMIETYKEMVHQNLKSVLLTSPGERIMDPEFGVGLRNYLFEMNNESTYDDISGKINEQVEKYLPFIEITSITFDDDEANALFMMVEYNILPLGIDDVVLIENGMQDPAGAVGAVF